MAGLIRLFSRRNTSTDIETTDGREHARSRSASIDMTLTPTNPPPQKVERRESTRLASGASKFIRAFRSGTSRKVAESGFENDLAGNFRRTFEPPLQAQLRISPNPKGPDGPSHPRHTPPRDTGRRVSAPTPTARTAEGRGPERSFSFQNGGNFKSGHVKASRSHVSRPVSFMSTAHEQHKTGSQQGRHVYENLEVIIKSLKEQNGKCGDTNSLRNVDANSLRSSHSYVNVPPRVPSNGAPPTTISTVESGGKFKLDGKESKGEKRLLRRSASEVPPDRIQNQSGSNMRQSSRSAFGGLGLTTSSSSSTSRNRNALWVWTTGRKEPASTGNDNIRVHDSPSLSSGLKDTAVSAEPQTVPPLPVRNDPPNSQSSKNLGPTRSTPNLVGDTRSPLPLSVHMPISKDWTSDKTDSQKAPGTGHEKYPSWPFPLGGQGQTQGHAGTKSWTEETKYAKEKLRPYVTPGFGKPGLEGLRTSTLPPPLAYRDPSQSPSNSNGCLLEPRWRDKGPPTTTSSSDDLDLSSSKRSTYAHSEGYHSFISDATSLTSSFDQLKCHPQATPAQNQHYLSQSYSASHLEISSGLADLVTNGPWLSEEESWAEELRQRSRTSPQLQATTSTLRRHSPPPLPERKESTGSYSSLKKPATTAATTRRPGNLQFGVPEEDTSGIRHSTPTIEISPTIDTRPPPSVAERIIDLESQAESISRANSRSNLSIFKKEAEQQAEGQKAVTSNGNGACSVDKNESEEFAYFDPEKRHLVPGNTLKAIQKQALLAYYERHAKKSLSQKDLCSPQSLETESPRLGPARQKMQAHVQNGENGNAYPVVPPGRPPKKPHLRNPKMEDSLVPPLPPPRPISRRHHPAPPIQSQKAPPPLPFKSTTYQGLPSPDLPPPPPHFLVDEEPPVDDPLPPPPTPTEMTLTAERMEDPSFQSEKVTEGQTLTSASPAAPRSQITSTLSPNGWEEYHNIGVPTTTTHDFTSTVSTTTMPFSDPVHKSSPLFLRSVSVDASNGPTTSNASVANSRGPPPVAQVAPLRGSKYCQRTTSMGPGSFKVIDIPEPHANLPALRGFQQTAKVSPLRDSRNWMETRHQSTTTSEASSQTEDAVETEVPESPSVSVSLEESRATSQVPAILTTASLDTKPKTVMSSQYSPVRHTDRIPVSECQDLRKQKAELMERLSRKLEILRREQEAIGDEIKGNETLGESVIEKVRGSAKRNEFDKFKLHVEEIGKITNLILGLSSRLSRAEASLLAISPNPTDSHEKTVLERKRDRLRDQLEEAELLKESIDRRATQVAGFLKTYLSPEDFADYVHFTSMKAKLIIDGREIEEKMKLGEEQMMALEESLHHEIPATKP